MKRLAQILTLALMLQSFAPAYSVVRAQTAKPSATAAKVGKPSPKAAKSGAVPAAYAEAIRQFDDFARRQMALDQTPGMSIAFMKDDFIWANGYGFADLENRSPAKAESAYRLASITKPMTAIAVLQLVEKGKINLDAEVQTYVPYFPKKPFPVTVRQVLGHLGGISHYKNYEQEGHFKTPKSTREAIAVFENFDLVAEPGTRYSYSSYGYNLLGAVVEAASGMKYGDYMRQNVWQPLGMNDTHMDDPLEIIPNRVRGYQPVDGKVKNSEFVDISSRFAAGGVRSTAPDLLKFAKGIIDGKLVSPETTKMLSTSMSTKAGRLTNYGMGWETTPYNGRYMLVHSGGQQETRTLLYVLPSRNMAIAVGVNYEGANPGVYVDRLFQLLTGAPLYLNAYSPDKLKAALADAIKSTFDYGLSSFEHHQKPLAETEGELNEAFAYFNDNVNAEALKANPQQGMQKIREGAHPVAKEAFTKVGSYMAQRLQQKNGAATMQTYAQRGGLAFFEDYITLSKNDASVPDAYRFKQPFATLVAEMARDWNKSNTEYVRQFWLMPDADLDAVGKSLRQSFAGASVYPGLVDDFFSVTRQHILKGKKREALKTSQLAVELYPDSQVSNFLQGIALVLNNDAAGGAAALKKSAAINPAPNAIASPGSLNTISYQIAGVGQLDDALAILNVAIELYPQDVNLYDSLGEFQLKKGEKAKALESYKKALEKNPKFGNAAKAEEIVKKLTAELKGS
jgi:CubicO group peptidase (beta-lactamase class C family)